AAERGQVFGGLVEGPGSAGQAEEFARVRADEARQAQTLVEGINAMGTAGTGQVEPLEANVARGRQNGTRDTSFIPGALQAVGTASAGRPFFSRTAILTGEPRKA